MKITKAKLKEIIKEEIEDLKKTLNDREDEYGRGWESAKAGERYQRDASQDFRDGFQDYLYAEEHGELDED